LFSVFASRLAAAYGLSLRERRAMTPCHFNVAWILNESGYNKLGLIGDFLSTHPTHLSLNPDVYSTFRFKSACKCEIQKRIFYYP